MKRINLQNRTIEVQHQLNPDVLNTSHSGSDLNHPAVIPFNEQHSIQEGTQQFGSFAQTKMKTFIFFP